MAASDRRTVKVVVGVTPDGANMSSESSESSELLAVAGAELALELLSLVELVVVPLLLSQVLAVVG